MKCSCRRHSFPPVLLYFFPWWILKDPTTSLCLFGKKLASLGIFQKKCTGSASFLGFFGKHFFIFFPSSPVTRASDLVRLWRTKVLSPWNWVWEQRQSTLFFPKFSGPYFTVISSPSFIFLSGRSDIWPALTTGLAFSAQKNLRETKVSLLELSKHIQWVLWLNNKELEGAKKAIRSWITPLQWMLQMLLGYKSHQFLVKLKLNDGNSDFRIQIFRLRRTKKNCYEKHHATNPGWFKQNSANTSG